MKIRATFLFASIFIATLRVFAAAEAPAPAEITQFATAVGSKWAVEQYKYGDLTGRKTKDAAIMVALNPEHAFGAAENRRLVIALRGADGKLHKTAEGTNSMPLGAGPAGGDPELEIKRNSVFVSQFGGSREKGMDTYQYKNVGGEWRLIGMTSEWYDSLDENIPNSKTDINFLTNYVEASIGGNKGGTKSVSFYEIPSTKGIPPTSNAEWKAPYLVLKSKDAADFSARVQSMHDANVLYLRITATDNSVLPEDSVKLEGAEPIKRMRTALPNGYVENLAFSLKAPPFANAISDHPEAAFLPLTLTIVDADNNAPALKRVTTAVSAKGVKPHGGLLLMPATNSYTLQNVDVRESSVHPLVFPI